MFVGEGKRKEKKRKKGIPKRGIGKRVRHTNRALKYFGTSMDRFLGMMFFVCFLIMMLLDVFFFSSVVERTGWVDWYCIVFSTKQTPRGEESVKKLKRRN